MSRSEACSIEFVPHPIRPERLYLETKLQISWLASISIFPKAPGQSCPPLITLRCSTYAQPEASAQVYRSTVLPSEVLVLGMLVIVGLAAQLLAVAQY